jgi:hypothetical protein
LLKVLPLAYHLLFNIKNDHMALKGDTVTFERTVNGRTQYKKVQALNLNSRKARAAYEQAGWKPSAGKRKPVGVTEPGTDKPKKGRQAKENPAVIVDEVILTEPETETENAE